jgi:hypothetical protein
MKEVKVRMETHLNDLENRIGAAEGERVADGSK